MDFKEPAAKRQKKKDKAREKFERNGAYSSKHVRAVEQNLAKGPTKSKGK